MVRLRKFRVEPDGLGAVGNRLVEVAFVAVGSAAALVRPGEFRVEPDGLSTVRNALS